MVVAGGDYVHFVAAGVFFKQWNSVTGKAKSNT
jgi:hypothetical protein